MQNSKTLPERKDMDDKNKWKLEDLYAHDDQWEEDFKKSKTKISDISRFEGRLVNSDVELLACLQHYEETGKMIEKILTTELTGRLP